MPELRNYYNLSDTSTRENMSQRWRQYIDVAQYSMSCPAYYDELYSTGRCRNAITLEQGVGNELLIRLSGPLDEWMGVDVRDLIRQMDEANATEIRMLIESPGGLLFDGLALYRDLVERAADGVRVTTEARGLVASAAILPFLAGEERIASEDNLFMIHNVSSAVFLFGNADELEKDLGRLLNGLRAANRAMIEIYERRTGNSALSIEQWLNDETWMTGAEALENKFATSSSFSKNDDDVSVGNTVADGQAICTAVMLNLNGGNYATA